MRSGVADALARGFQYGCRRSRFSARASEARAPVLGMQISHGTPLRAPAHKLSADTLSSWRTWESASAEPRGSIHKISMTGIDLDTDWSGCLPGGRNSKVGQKRASRRASGVHQNCASPKRSGGYHSDCGTLNFAHAASSDAVGGLHLMRCKGWRDGICKRHTDSVLRPQNDHRTSFDRLTGSQLKIVFSEHVA